MGLLDLAFPGNQFSAWLDPNRNKVTGFFGGMVGGGNDPRGTLQGAINGLQGGVAPDNAFVQQQQLQAEKSAAVKAEQDKQAAQIAWLRQNGQNQYADMLEAGFLAPTDVGKQLTAPATPVNDPASIAEYKFYANQELQAGRKPKSFAEWQTGDVKPLVVNDQIVDPATGNVLGDYRNPEKPSAAPAGYRPGANGGLEFIPGGPADPATAGKTTEATRRNQQLAKVMVPEAQALLGSAGAPGTFDALTDPKNMAAGSNSLTYGLASPEYQQAQNSLKTIIASYLYSVSGATANPGEVETQASVLTPKFGESQASIDAKKARIQQMVQAVVDAAQGTNIPPGMATDSTGDPALDAALAQYGG